MHYVLERRALAEGMGNYVALLTIYAEMKDYGCRMMDLDQLEPLEREAMSSIIADRIRGAITDGRFAVGARLGEAELAKQLAVSRGPVREALQRLIQEGLLREERHRGVFVVELGLEDIDDIYLARAAVERAAATLLVHRADDTVVATLEKKVAEMEGAAATVEGTTLAELDLEFHEALIVATGSKRLLRMFRTLLAETRICLARLEPSYPVPSDLASEHRRIADALRRRDEAAMLAQLETHFDFAVRVLKSAQGGDSGVAPRVGRGSMP